MSKMGEDAIWLILFLRDKGIEEMYRKDGTLTDMVKEMGK